MMEKYSTEFWIICLFIIDFVLVLLILFFTKNIKSGIRKYASSDASRQVHDLIRPALEDARSLAGTFDEQIREKQRLIKELNEKLDDRIISLNLLIKRTEEHFTDIEARQKSMVRQKITPRENLYVEPAASDVQDQQHMVLELFNRGYESDYIAGKLSLPKAEVDLVVNLKKKLLEMEQGV